MSEVVAVAGQPLGAVDAATDAWLQALADGLRIAEHLIGGEGPGGPVLRRADGGWHAGPVVGQLWLAGRRLTIAAPQARHATQASLVAALWCRAMEAATRHGPPAFRRDIEHVGASLRGRLDVRRTARLRACASSNVASVYRARDLRNDIARALVAADRALTRQVGDDRWRTRRVREVMPALHDAIGRTSPPTLAELRRIRYTPITLPFRDAAELSVRIVLQDPVVTTTERGRPQGIVMPVAVTAGLVAAVA